MIHIKLAPSAPSVAADTFCFKYAALLGARTAEEVGRLTGHPPPVVVSMEFPSDVRETARALVREGAARAAHARRVRFILGMGACLPVWAGEPRSLPLPGGVHMTAAQAATLLFLLRVGGGRILRCIRSGGEGAYRQEWRRAEAAALRALEEALGGPSLFAPDMSLHAGGRRYCIHPLVLVTHTREIHARARDALRAAGGDKEGWDSVPAYGSPHWEDFVRMWAYVLRAGTGDDARTATGLGELFVEGYISQHAALAAPPDDPVVLARVGSWVLTRHWAVCGKVAYQLFHGHRVARRWERRDDGVWFASPFGPLEDARLDRGGVPGPIRPTPPPGYVVEDGIPVASSDCAN